MSALALRGVTARYGQVKVLHGLDLEVGAGELVVVLGANGAGKTTTIRAVNGTVERAGAIEFEGRDISRASAESIVRRGIAQVPQGRGTFPELTVDDNLRAGGHVLKGRDVRPQIDRWYAQFPRLAARRQQRAGSLSGGEQQMLAIARALMSRPRLLLCDEPSLGLAPKITRELFAVLADLNEREGLGVLLVEQNANLAMSLADRVYVLETGRIVLAGDAERIRGDDALRIAYLGF